MAGPAPNPYVIDFSAGHNMLARWGQQQQQQRQMEQQADQFQQTNMLARDQFGESQRQHGIANQLARDQFGLQQRTADRADEMAPGQLELQKAQISHARAQGASEAQLLPLNLQIRQAEARLAQAKAEGKDSETVMVREIFGGGQPAAPQSQPPPQFAPGVRPQSFNGGGQPMMPTLVGDAGEPQAGPRNALASPQQSDPNLILAQSGPTPQPPAAPASPKDVMAGMSPAQRAQFGMAWMGKGEAAKVFGEAAGADKLGKEARNKLDEQEMNAANAVGRLKQIASGYKDEWLTWEGQWKQYGAALLDKSSTLRAKMKPEQVQALEEYTAFQRDAYENLTIGIKEATGAAMGVQEEVRIRKGMPDPDKDSPTQFKAKLLGTMRSLETSTQRTQFLRQNGFKGDANAAAARMPLERFQGLLNDSRTLYQKLKTENPSADDGAIRDSVRQTIVRKYGIAA